MKVCLIGCVDFSASALRTLFSLEDSGVCSVAGVITRRSSKFNADFADLSKVVADAGRPHNLVHYYENEDEAAIFIANRKADIVFCFGWSSLLGPKLLSSAPGGVIGFHPAQLPENRGRHPIIWALALGLEQTATTFFQMDEGADSGPILSQELINIDFNDNAQTLYQKVTKTALKQIEAFSWEISQGVASFREQDASLATYWRKRTPADGLIDWRMSATDIHNLVRALFHPYPGAEFRHEGKPVKLWVTRLAGSQMPANLEPGKVLERRSGEVLVKCGGRTGIWLCEFEPYVKLNAGDYL